MMKNIFLTFEKWTERLAEHAALAGGLLMLVCCFMVSAEILLRKLFNHSIGGADELTGYALGIATSWSFAYALACRANIRIDSLYMMLPLRYRVWWICWPCWPWGPYWFLPPSLPSK